MKKYIAIAQITENLSIDIRLFSSLFMEFRFAFFDNQEQTLQESALGQWLTAEAKQVLTDLKNCQERVSSNIDTLENMLSSGRILTGKESLITYNNLQDFLQTCNTVCAQFDVFVRKDIPLLKETFTRLLDSIKQLDTLLQNYNQKVDKNRIMPIVNPDYEILNKVTNLGFDIIEFSKISLTDFQSKCPFVDTDFVKFLKQVEDDLHPRESYKWMNLLYTYFDNEGK